MNEARWLRHSVDSIRGRFDIDAPVEVGKARKAHEVFDGSATPTGKQLDDQLDDEIPEVAVEVFGEKREKSTGDFFFLIPVRGRGCLKISASVKEELMERGLLGVEW